MEVIQLSYVLRLAGYGFIALLALVALNICRQVLLPHSKSEPPTVFHWLPYIGNAVSYGMDPVAFFTKYRAKASLVSLFSSGHGNCQTCLANQMTKTVWRRLHLYPLR
jgi:sterol 14-demethylase